jgi:hypothetical protein
MAVHPGGERKGPGQRWLLMQVPVWLLDCGGRASSAAAVLGRWLGVAEPGACALHRIPGADESPGRVVNGVRAVDHRRGAAGVGGVDHRWLGARGRRWWRWRGRGGWLGAEGGPQPREKGSQAPEQVATAAG